MRSFTQLRRGVLEGGRISPEKIAEVVAVVSSQLMLARELGAAEVLGVATAAVRRAANGAELIAAVRDACGLEVVVLSEEQEARMAFIGAATTLGHLPDGELGVVDVGGGSSELVVGVAPDEVRWSTSFALGSGDLADRCLRSDPPSEARAARRPRPCPRGACRHRSAPAGRGRRRRGHRHLAAAVRRGRARLRCLRPLAAAARDRASGGRSRRASGSTPNGCACCRPGC